MASASFCRGKGASDAPTMAQDVGKEAVAACGLRLDWRGGCGRRETTPTGGARRSAARHGAQARGNGWRPSGPAGLAGPSKARGWANGWWGAGPRGGERGELGCGAGPSGERGEGASGPISRKERKKMILSFSISSIFQNPF